MLSWDAIVTVHSSKFGKLIWKNGSTTAFRLSGLEVTWTRGRVGAHTHTKWEGEEWQRKWICSLHIVWKKDKSDWPPCVIHSSPPSSSTPILALHADWNMRVGEIGLRGLRLGRAFLWETDLCCARWVRMELPDWTHDANNWCHQWHRRGRGVRGAHPTSFSHSGLVCQLRHSSHIRNIRQEMRSPSECLSNIYSFNICIQPWWYGAADCGGAPAQWHYTSGFILSVPQPIMAPNVKVETPSVVFQPSFLFIGSLHNFKIGRTSERHTNGPLPSHGTLRYCQSFLDVSTPSTLSHSFCLFNSKNMAEPVLCLLLLYRTCNGENVSLTPD